MHSYLYYQFVILKIKAENANPIIVNIDELAEELVSFYWNGLVH